jgi:hypothetical protein
MKKYKVRHRAENRGQDRHVEAKPSLHLNQVMKATENLPFSFTMFFTDEHNNSIKYGRFVKVQAEYNG